VETSATRQTPPSPTDFSPQASLWKQDPLAELQVHRWAHQVGAQPKWRVWNLLHGEPCGRRRHNHDPKGTRAEVPRSGSHDVPLMLPFHAPANTIRNMTKESHSVTAQYATSNEAGQLCPASTNSREASIDVTTQDAGEGT
jgi:hypothetical protein